MKTIKEIRPEGETRYEMPDEVYEVIEAALRWGVVKTVSAAVARLPADLRRQVKVTMVCKALPAGPLRGRMVHVMMIDDYSFNSEYQQTPIPPEPEQSLDALGRPIFRDQSKGGE